jgi:hypothetical protein
VNNLTGLLDDRGHVDTNNVLGTSASSEPVRKYGQWHSR